MEISWIRIYLLSGLLLHKAIWEFLKSCQGDPSAKQSWSAKVLVLSTVKIGILFGIIAQTFLPVVLPISDQPSGLAAAGVVFYTLGLTVAIAGRVQLGRNWTDIEKSYVKREHQLVSHGLYRFVRHPIYTGDLLLLFGLELALNSWLVLGVAALAVYVRRKAIHEEQKLTEAIPEYGGYCRRTTRFVPFLPV